MKTLIKDYTFNAASGTVTFSSFASVSLEDVMMIINETDGVIIYNFADPAKIGTVSSNILTLAYDTTTMADSDSLAIWYWVSAYATQINDNSGNSDITYIGKAVPGTLTSASTWQIKRLTASGTALAIEWADSNTNFDNVYDNRESLTYG